MSSYELVTIVDERNRVVGSASRQEMRSGGLIHRATYVLVFNSRGELFVQRRTASKDIYPRYYDVAAGGVVLAGESWDESAAREVEEELGVRGAPLQPLFELYYGDEGNRVWGAAYACTWDGPLTLQEEEVEWGAFLPVPEVLRLTEREPFTPDGLAVLRRYLAPAPGTRGPESEA
ncbi:MAG: NUDIX hydrolase YfcD [Deltaproteobacteria bacterium]|nr:NUDIX hydrolase YfcD [Deltaproteobacteria bacterium]